MIPSCLYLGIDFIKARVIYFPEILDNEYLDFKYELSSKTGELSNHRKAEFKDLEFIYYNSGFLRIQGSLHKYYNDGLHNYDDFTVTKLLWVLNDLEKRFDLKLTDLKLENLEFGVNITDVTSFDYENLMLQRGKRFDRICSGTVFKVEHSEQIIKVYNKGVTEKLGHFLVRYEVKIKKSRKLNKLNVYTLDDLKQRDVYPLLESYLLQEWANVLYVDEELDVRTVKFWKSLKGMKKKRTIEKFNANNLVFNSMAMAIESKCKELRKC